MWLALLLHSGYSCGCGLINCLNRFLRLPLYCCLCSCSLLSLCFFFILAELKSFCCFSCLLSSFCLFSCFLFLTAFLFFYSTLFSFFCFSLCTFFRFFTCFFFCSKSCLFFLCTTDLLFFHLHNGILGKLHGCSCSFFLYIFFYRAYILGILSLGCFHFFCSCIRTNLCHCCFYCGCSLLFCLLTCLSDLPLCFFFSLGFCGFYHLFGFFLCFTKRLIYHLLGFGFCLLYLLCYCLLCFQIRSLDCCFHSLLTFCLCLFGCFFFQLLYTFVRLLCKLLRFLDILF